MQSESKCALVYGQMNEPPGARARVGLTGLTVAEHFRDAEGQDVLLFIDNIFRFTQVTLMLITSHDIFCSCCTVDTRKHMLSFLLNLPYNQQNIFTYMPEKAVCLVIPFQANSEVSALLGRIPSAVGYQPTLATDLGGLQERITTTKKGSITSVQAIYVPADDLTDPAPATTFAHLDATTVLSRQVVYLISNYKFCRLKSGCYGFDLVCAAWADF